jgi:hypothetical protein
MYPIATFDRRGFRQWTDVFDCDACGVNYVAVYDPYGTCALVICASCNGGSAIAGPIDEPWHDDDDRFDDFDDGKESPDDGPEPPDDGDERTEEDDYELTEEEEARIAAEFDRECLAEEQRRRSALIANEKSRKERFYRDLRISFATYCGIAAIGLGIVCGALTLVSVVAIEPDE